MLTAVPAHAQDEDAQLWLQVNASAPLAERVKLTLEQIARIGDRQGGLFQTELGGIVAYRVSDQIELGFGYRRVGFHNGNRSEDENRLRQHIVATFGRLVGRLRVDERFHPGGDEIGFRIRPLLRYNQPLGKGGLKLFISHESFYLPNATRWGQRSGYERMRNSVGFTIPLGKLSSVDVGYLNQYRPGRSGSPAQMDHALSTQLTLSIGSHTSSQVED
ncbi:DUF2490 domain-containing protein [Sphingomonas donggukensis]|uniref:DUF2490 domain-containing protein n=1 Tax=Sphingomonas donggukensis TaxID=2949093 RepID=A0ABY4TWA7_9SPHN|nr:DUF2490 domain-containing protein [Sphingomonas donggukensis]URW74608.1 DUF2490 domain-containing protein [Sphingomonas donggukensis]